MNLSFCTELLVTFLESLILYFQNFDDLGMHRVRGPQLSLATQQKPPEPHHLSAASPLSPLSPLKIEPKKPSTPSWKANFVSIPPIESLPSPFHGPIFH
jgi:hypothetical protein